MARKKSSKNKEIGQYDHTDKERLNNPPVGLVTAETDRDMPKKRYSYDPHLDPQLNCDARKLRDDFEEMLRAAMDENDPEKRAEILEPIIKASQPWLEWAGKKEHTTFDVDTVSLHVQERIDPYRVIGEVRKAKQQSNLNLFFDSKENNPPLREAIEFYKHRMNWTNRMVAGDSLLVMNSLLEKEGMAGKVQMIYIDPPYGIKYGSNFQPFVNKRDVKDGKDEDLTAEPEMIKAYRDTWELGIHSYLTYLRDRLLLARELLTESGSVFVQISDENVHHVREIMDEVFGKENFVSLITFRKKTGPLGAELLPQISDYLIWYGKDISTLKFRKLYRNREVEGDSIWSFVELPDGTRRKMSPEEVGKHTLLPNAARIFRRRTLSPAGFNASATFDVEFEGKFYPPPKRAAGASWATNEEGMKALIKAKRVIPTRKTLDYVYFLDDFPYTELVNVWSETRGETDKHYVVQTDTTIVQRCLLMTTDPGDLVLDPTCGSGTTAYVAEKWGRRWITIDTSRVAILLAKMRLMTSLFPYYSLAYPEEGVGSGFKYRTVPHITLKSIANNPEIDRIYDGLHPKIEAELAAFNRKAGLGFKEWEVPPEWDNSWPEDVRYHYDNFMRLKREMHEQMDAAIQENAPQETLYDRPEEDKTKVRVTGPFTVESVPAPMVRPIDDIGEDTQGADASAGREGETARINDWISELLRTGVRAKSGNMIMFSRMEPFPGTRWIHAYGETKDGKCAAVSFGPTYAPMESRQVEMAIEEARTLVPKPELIIFASFQFDPEAAKDIDETKWPGMAFIKVQMNTDLLTEDLKKKRAGNQSFWLIGQPDVDFRKLDDKNYEVEVNGFDYYDPATGKIESGGKSKIALWMLDVDYDGRSLYPSQIFFPMAGAKDGRKRLSKTLKAEIDEEKVEKLGGTVSLPFDAGEHRRIAVKIVDDRGIESMKILEVE